MRYVLSAAPASFLCRLEFASFETGSHMPVMPLGRGQIRYFCIFQGLKKHMQRWVVELVHFLLNKIILVILQQCTTSYVNIWVCIYHTIHQINQPINYGKRNLHLWLNNWINHPNKSNFISAFCIWIKVTDITQYTK